MVKNKLDNKRIGKFGKMNVSDIKNIFALIYHQNISTQHAPILFKMAQEYKRNKITAEEFVYVARILESYIVRTTIRGGKGDFRAGEAAQDRFFGYLIENNSKKFVINVKEFFKTIGVDEKKERDISYPNNKQILTASDKEFEDASITPYILCTIEEQLHVEDLVSRKISKGFSANEIYVNIDVEHILRKTTPCNTMNKCTEHKKPYTFDYSDEEHEIIRKKLGNLTLLTKPTNRAKREKGAGDKCPQCKIEDVYPNSDFRITQQITRKYKTWNRSSMKKRTKELLDYVNNYWPEINKINIEK